MREAPSTGASCRAEGRYCRDGQVRRSRDSEKLKRRWDGQIGEHPARAPAAEQFSWAAANTVYHRCIAALQLLVSSEPYHHQVLIYTKRLMYTYSEAYLDGVVGVVAEGQVPILAGGSAGGNCGKKKEPHRGEWSR